MPEGDTLARIAVVLGATLTGGEVTSPHAAGLAERSSTAWSARESITVEARGKHLLIGFSNGLTLHTHLALHGQWHRYRTGERWRRSPSRAVAVVETATTVAVCFDAPTVELIETRALAIHPSLSRLGTNTATDGLRCRGGHRGDARPESRTDGDRRRTARPACRGRVWATSIAASSASSSG